MYNFFYGKQAILKRLKRLTLPQIHIMLRLHLLRHSEPHAFGSFKSDKERSLSEYGKMQCETLRTQLDLDWSDITIWCSTANRTRETALNLVPASVVENIEFKDELYHATIRMLFDLVTTHEGTKELMIIGHNNGLTDFLNYLSDRTIIMQTGHYICLEFHLDQWNEVSRSLATVVHELVP